MPKNDLDSLGVDALLPVELKQLEELIDKYSQFEKELSKEEAQDTQGSPELVSSFYVAKLVGADLLSERSRLAFAGDRVTAPIAVRPWSLAVQLPAGAGSLSELAGIPNWSFDGMGIPLILPTAVGPKKYATQFGWSAKSVAESTTNKLNFSFNIPKCANSCLVLALPPQATIEDCATVVRRIDDWSSIAVRLSAWEDFEKTGGRDLNPSRSPESLWLIELGGSSLVSFSIALGGGSQSKYSESSEFQPYKHLIRSQTVEHQVEEYSIRTTCEAVVYAPVRQMMRIQLAPEARLRRLRVNQQDVEWSVEDGWIQWRMGGTSARTEDVFVEYSTPLLPEKQSHFELPKIAIVQGYVMSGAEVVTCNNAWRLTHSECESGRLSDRSVDQKSGITNRLEYSWYASPPTHNVGIERIPTERRCEVLSRLGNDANRTTALIRAKLYFAEQDANQTSFLIAPHWTVGAIQSLDPNDTFTVQSSSDTQSDATVLQVQWGRLQKSRVADVEIVLHRNWDASEWQTRRLESLHLLQMPGWKRTDTIVVDESPVFELRLHDSLCDLLVFDESIPDWQKTYVPRTGRFYVFSFDSMSSEIANSQPAIGRSEPNAILSAPPEFVWQEVLNRPQASVKTQVEKFSETSLIAKHEIQLSVGANLSKYISISLPCENPIWRVKVKDKTGMDEARWTPISPLKESTAIANPTTGLWLFDSSSLGQDCTLMAIVHSKTADSPEVVFSVPKVSNARNATWEARSLSNDISIRSNSNETRWAIDDVGFKFLRSMGSETPDELIATMPARRDENKWFAVQRELHVAIDSMGTQKGLLVLRSVSPSHHPVAIDLPDGWGSQSVSFHRSGNRVEMPFRKDGSRLILSPDPVGGFEIRVDLVGPRLPKNLNAFGLGETYLFQWPNFTLDAELVGGHCYLWLPSELQIAGSGPDPAANQGWPMWYWTQLVIGALTGSQPSELQRDSGRVGPLGMIPAWAEDGWRVVQDMSETHDEFSDRAVGKSKDFFAIASTGADRSVQAMIFMLFALATPRLLTVRWHLATFIALGLIGLSHGASSSFSQWASCGLIGMIAGFCAMVIHRLLSVHVGNEGSVSQKNSAKWTKWDEREAEHGSSVSQGGRSIGKTSPMSNLGSLGVCLTFAMGWGAAQACFVTAPSEDPVYQVVIPMDEAGNMSGSNVYVPKELMEVLTGAQDRVQKQDRGTRPIAARYSLRVGARSRGFIAADQITIGYDFFVGEDLEPYRLPINVLQLQLPRISVDGTELSLGASLRSNGSEWIWTPDKPGKRTIQIVAQPILKSIESERNRDPLVQMLDIAILPIANAQLEIETDFQNTVEVVARGRVTDPAAGRFLAMLGAVERLQCNVMSPVPNSAAFPNAVNLEIEVPLMHTELFMQGDILQAKTIVDFPKGLTTGATIEIEADSQWLPIGTHWGDAEWIETRPGSTLGKRRYVLEWKNSQSNTPSASTRDRQIAAIWIPQSANSNLNILFAECRDRRTRRGTLRYSRAFDANWNLDGISTWIPAIGSKDRLDWPELNVNPIATSLRIPPNGGFGGVLKSKVQTERPQAQITTKWVVAQHRESLTSVINLRGGSSSSEPLVVELPSDYTVTELYNGNGPIRYLQRRNKGRVCIQVLTDRKALEVSLLIVQAKRNVQVRAPRFGPEGNWQEFPWVVLPTSINADQKLEVTATESFALRLESDPAVIFGRGPNAPILNLERFFSDHNSNSLVPTRYQIASRVEPISGQVTVKLNSKSNGGAIEVLGQFSSSVFSRSNFILEIPALLKERMQSDTKIRALPCPDPAKAWIQIQLPEKSTAPESHSLPLLRFTPRSDEPGKDLELMNSIRPLDRNLTAVIESDEPQEELDRDAMGSLTPTKAIEKSSSVSVINWMMRVKDHDWPQSKPFVLVESEFWIEESAEMPSQERPLEWLIEEDVELLAIAVDGSPVDFLRDGNRVRCSIVQAGLCAEVILFSKHPVETNREGTRSIHVLELVNAKAVDGPKWLAENLLSLKGIGVSVASSGQSISPTWSQDAIVTNAQACLDVLENSRKAVVDIAKLDALSDLGKWDRYWVMKAQSYLEDWAVSPLAAAHASFGETVNRWHAMKERFSKNDRPAASQAAIGRNRLESIERLVDVQPANRWYSFMGCLLLVLLIHMLVPTGQWFYKHPWWCLISLGCFAWIVSGYWFPAIVLGAIALVIAVDSYWIVTSRLRRSGIRGLRSL